MAQENINLEKVVTPGQLVTKRFLRNKLAIVGVGILIAMFIFSFLGPLISPYGEYTIFYHTIDGVEFSTENLQGNNPAEIGVTIANKQSPSSLHWFGTDKDGRDIFTRLMYGGRISLTIGFVVVLFQLGLGVTLGGIAGYFGGKIDNLIMRMVDIMYCLPALPIMLIISSLLLAYDVPQDQKIYWLTLVMGIMGWAGVARLVRGQILSLREQEFMVATEATGIHPSRRILKHLVPNVMPQLIVVATMGMGGVILTEAAYSYLGIGVPFPYASWGNMVNVVKDPIILREYIFMWLPPGVFILTTVLGFNFVGDGLRDAFDPKMKR
ncbi:ABC transporter permease [Candidatus Epulonipiscium fishelsonii]|uniref:ABC transporter permease n=1 Tax=Candidatus Epulonipiscium fishelsonii TaxID=77094 RepID=A0ACC8XBG6_9FIRM|nr:ABC transporter permease [Epulopiscium sp. SCG-D08WGA-EpuloA1]OON90431.1 MAG: ABC transporter permease [Epulopiscium sp. AS2M-Bin002]